jgi:protein-disulfide isomerase
LALGKSSRDKIRRMMKNINLSSSRHRDWPVRQIVLGAVLFVSGIAVGYAGHDFLPSLSLDFGTSFQMGSSANDDPSWGPSNAKVTVVEFGDFECSSCRSWFNSVYTRLATNYSDKIRFVFRDFPLPQFASESKPAAVAANCAGEQGKYWDYFRILYSDPRGLAAAELQIYAQEVGLNLSSFNSCIASGKYDAEIQADIDDGMRMGVNGTPTFFINGKPISGPVTFEAFQQRIDAELNK